MYVYGWAGVVAAALFGLVFAIGRATIGCNTAELALIEGAQPGPLATHSRAEPVPLGPMLQPQSVAQLWPASSSQIWAGVSDYLVAALSGRGSSSADPRAWLDGRAAHFGRNSWDANGWLDHRCGDAAHRARWGRVPMALTRFAGMAAYAVCPLLDSPWAITAVLCLWGGYRSRRPRRMGLHARRRRPTRRRVLG